MRFSAWIDSMILGAQYELTSRRDLADVSMKTPPCAMSPT